MYSKPFNWVALLTDAKVLNFIGLRFDLINGARLGAVMKRSADSLLLFNFDLSLGFFFDFDFMETSGFYLSITIGLNDDV